MTIFNDRLRIKEGLTVELARASQDLNRRKRPSDSPFLAPHMREDRRCLNHMPTLRRSPSCSRAMVTMC